MVCLFCHYLSTLYLAVSRTGKIISNAWSSRFLSHDFRPPWPEVVWLVSDVCHHRPSNISRKKEHLNWIKEWWIQWKPQMVLEASLHDCCLMKTDIDPYYRAAYLLFWDLWISCLGERAPCLGWNKKNRKEFWKQEDLWCFMVQAWNNSRQAPYMQMLAHMVTLPPPWLEICSCMLTTVIPCIPYAFGEVKYFLSQKDKFMIFLESSIIKKNTLLTPVYLNGLSID